MMMMMMIIIIIIIHLDALFLFDVFKNKLDCCSIMVIFYLHVPTKQIRDFSTFKASYVSRLSPSTRCVTAVNRICRSLDVFRKHTISSEDTFSLLNRTELRH
jgi:hypothetical protein